MLAQQAQTGVSLQGILTLLVIALIVILAKLPSSFWAYLGKKVGSDEKLKKQTKGKEDMPNLPADVAEYAIEERKLSTPPPPDDEPLPEETTPDMPPIEKDYFEGPPFEDYDVPEDTPLDDPLRLLNPASWGEMCRKRKLSGLQFLGRDNTPFGVDVRVKFGGALSFAYVQSNIDQLRTGLNLPQDWRIQLKQGASSAYGIVRIITRDPFEKQLVWESSPKTVRLADPVKLSRTAYGEDVSISVKRRIGIFGTSGSGKSCTQRIVGAHVIQAVDADLEIWDLKFGLESQHFEGKAHRVTTVLDAVERVTWLMEKEYPRRARLMKGWKTSTWDETPEHKARVIIIDEGNRIVRGFQTGQLKQLSTAIETGRALGVYFVWATQYPKAENLPTEIRSQLDCRICMLLLSSEESAVVYKDEVKEGWAPHLLTGPGWMLIKDVEHKVPEESKALWLSKEVIPTVPLSGSVSTVEEPQCLVKVESTVAEDIWAALAFSEEPLGVSELSRRTGRTKSAVHDALGRMEREGRVCKTGTDTRPVWCLPLSE